MKQLKKYPIWCIFQLQKAITCFLLFLFLAKIRNSRKNRKFLWTIGVQEIAGMLHNISNVVAGSVSINFTPHRFNYGRYDYQAKYKRTVLIGLLVNIIQGPYYFVKSLAMTDGIIYIGSDGFLISSVDERKFEFHMAKIFDKKIVCVLTGSDIRSIKLMTNSNRLDENIASCISLMFPHMASDSFDEIIRKRCEIINKYSDLTYSAPEDQKSYLENQKFFPYMLSDKWFNKNITKFDEIKYVKIVHAPSSPILKGTLLIRNAIRRLLDEGYKIEYVELFDVDHALIESMLENAHIAINELYSFLPGVFGIEAMAKSCVLITRASSLLEPSLPTDCDSAWIQSESYNIYEKIKLALENRSDLGRIALKGYEWTWRNASETNAGLNFNKSLDALLSRIE